MKIYISADIEGITGIVDWDEATRWKPDYPPFCQELMQEVISTCEGANNAGAKEIWIKDAHGIGRNLSFTGLPSNTTLIRSFSGHPFCMMQELDNTFDAVVMVGYHSYAGSDGNPLSHTLEDDMAYIKINGEFASEFLLNSYTASLVGVPVVFVSGDTELCKAAHKINPNIKTVETSKGVGNSVISRHPDVVNSNIKDGVEEALKSQFRNNILPLPKSFEVELSYNLHTKAYKASFYPGMKQVSTRNLEFGMSDYFEVLRMLSFVV